MYGSEIRQSDPTRLATILELAGADSPWQPGELGAVLRHQLAAPLEFSGPTAPGDGAEGILTVGDLLSHPQAPLSLLQKLKSFAKVQAVDPNHFIPQEIAAVLYYAAICAAALRRGRRITELDFDSLQTGITQLLECGWVDESIRRLFNDGLIELRKLPTAG
jgi:hypothetical protein